MSFGRSVPVTVLILVPAVLVLPVFTGLVREEGYAVRMPVEFFSLGIEFIALVSPLLAGLLATSRLNGEVGDGFMRSVRTRSHVRGYLARRFRDAALIAFTTFFASMLLWFLVAFILDPVLQITTDPGGTYPTRHEALEASAGYATFTQLLSVNVWLYGVFYSAWVGLWAAVWAMLTALLLTVIPNRIVAYATPLALYWAENIVLSNLGAGVWRSTSSAFPFSVVQQPVLTAFAPLAAWIIATLALWRWLDHRARYETVPLT